MSQEPIVDFTESGNWSFRVKQLYMCKFHGAYPSQTIVSLTGQAIICRFYGVEGLKALLTQGIPIVSFADSSNYMLYSVTIVGFIESRRMI